MRLDSSVAEHNSRWPTAILREAPAAVQAALTEAISEVGGPADAHRATACRKTLADLRVRLQDQASRLRELTAAAPDRAGIDALVVAAARDGFQLTSGVDVRDPGGALIGHAITLRAGSGNL